MSYILLIVNNYSYAVTNILKRTVGKTITVS